ncbi:MAG: hypothetical protein ACTSPY_05840 [Candidatus Helarchaeota archaeon]
MKKWIITIKYSKNFLSIFNSIHNKYNLSNLYEKTHLINKNSIDYQQFNQILPFSHHIELYDFLAGISYHEFGHSKECPIDSLNFSIIIQAISTVLEQNKRFNQDCLNYIANLFTDTIVNTIYGLNSKNSFYRNSLFLFYLFELEHFGHFEPGFLLFLLLNVKLFQFDPKIRSGFEKRIYPKMFTGFDKILENLIRIFCPFSEIMNNMILGVKLFEDEKWKCINYVSDIDNWAEMAYKFTKIIMDYIPKIPLPTPQQPIPDSYFTRKLKEDNLFRKSILDKIIQRKIKVPIIKDIKRKKVSKPLKVKVNQNINNLDSKQEKYPGEFDLEYGLALYNNFEFLDALYRYRTKNIKIIIPKNTNGTQFPITWFNRKILEEYDDFTNFDPLNVYFIPNSDDLLLFKKTIPFNYNISGSFTDKGFPNLVIIYDDSGSMNWEPLTGKGKYDAVIIMIYSLFKWLKIQGFAPVINYNLTSFSTTTRTTGWIDYFHLDKFLKVLFSYEGGETRLDPNIFKDIINHPKNKIIVFISDGIISNASELKEILYNYKHKDTFLLIQIGKSSKFSNELKSQGFSVIVVKDVLKLSEIVLDFMKNKFNF